MTDIIKFTHEMFGEIRVTDKNGDAWFIAKDIADRLDYSDSRNLLEIVDEEDKSSIISTLSGISPCPQKVSIINESGLYQAIIRSTKPEAKQFKRWVTSEVLPSIRKTGSYSVKPQLPQNYVEALKALVVSEEAKQLALQQAQEIKEKKEFSDRALGGMTANRNFYKRAVEVLMPIPADERIDLWTAFRLITGRPHSDNADLYSVIEELKVFKEAYHGFNGRFSTFSRRGVELFKLKHPTLLVNT